MSPAEWRLSEIGAADCRALACELARFRPVSLASSPERKAVETAAAIGAELGLPIAAAREGLRERERAPRFLPRAEFERETREFFDSPSAAARGRESAERAAARIEREARLAAAESDGCALLVTHGAAMASFIALRAAGCGRSSGWDVWKSLHMPAHVAFAMPTFGIVASKGVELTPPSG